MSQLSFSVAMYFCDASLANTSVSYITSSRYLHTSALVNFELFRVDWRTKLGVKLARITFLLRVAPEEQFVSVPTPASVHCKHT